MNETAKTRKKKPSLWWIWIVLILAAFAGGIIVGLKMTSLPLPNDLKMMLISAVVPSESGAPVETPAPEATPAPETPAPEATQDPAETPAPEATEVAVLAAVETQAPVFAADAPERGSAPASYIGIDAALEAALAHAGIAKEDATVSGVFRTQGEDGLIVYEVDFSVDGITYEYQINALSGAIEGWLMSGFTYSESVTFGAAQPEETAAPVEEEDEGFTEQKALELALAYAGVEAEAAKNVKVRLTNKFGAEVFDIQFRTEAGAYEYELDAGSGEILGFKKP